MAAWIKPVSHHEIPSAFRVCARDIVVLVGKDGEQRRRDLLVVPEVVNRPDMERRGSRDRHANIDAFIEGTGERGRPSAAGVFIRALWPESQTGMAGLRAVAQHELRWLRSRHPAVINSKMITPRTAPRPSRSQPGASRRTYSSADEFW
jgi:hypothetical protein